MRRAYVLLTTEMGFESDILKQIKMMSDVKEAYALYGAYDLIARLEAEDSKILKDKVLRIRHLEKVRSTMTRIEQE